MDGEGWEVGIVTWHEFPNGLRCSCCHSVMPFGSAYTSRSTGHNGIELICPGCSV